MAENSCTAVTQMYILTASVSAETHAQLKQPSLERQRARRADALVPLARNWLNRDHSASKNADRYQVIAWIIPSLLRGYSMSATSL